MSQRIKRSLLLAALLFLVAGCESSNEDFVVVGGQLQPRGSMTGRLQLGTGVEGARITAVDASGRTLAETTTDEGGGFDVENFQAPPEFAVVARVGENLEFSTVVTGYGGGDRYVVINVPTSLVSRLVAAGLSFGEATSRVQSFLQIPADRSLEYGIEESPRAPFSHIAFMQRAGTNGGWTAFRDAVVGGILSEDASPTTAGPFLLNRAAVSTPITGLDIAISAPLESLRNSARLQELVRSVEFDRVFELANLTAGALPPGAVTAQKIDTSGVRASLVSSVLEIVGEGAKKQIIDVGWTHIADACHWNYGTTTMLGDIENTVGEINGAVSDLKNALDAYQLQTASSDAQNTLTSFQTTSETLKGFSYANNNTINVPVPANATLNGFIKDSLKLNDLQTSVGVIQSACLGLGGTTNIVTLNRDNIYQDQLGIQGGQSFNFSPVRSNAGILPSVLSTFQYYGQAQVLGMNLVAESAHVSVTNPTLNIMQALNFITGIDPTGTNPLFGDVSSLKQQRNQLPQALMSDQIVVDLQGGLMWYAEVQPATTYNNANRRATGFSLDVGSNVTLGDWRLPTDQELYLLQDRGRLVETSLRDSSVDSNGSSGYGQYGFSAQGLTALGFTYVSRLNDPSNDKGYCPTFATDYTWDKHGTDHWVYQPLDFFLNRESNTTNDEDGSGNYAYFMVRNIGEPVLVDDRNAPDGNYAYPYQNPASAEFTTLGYMTALTQTFGINSSQAGVQATFTINTGGSFSMGNNDASDSRDLTSRTYTQSVSSNSADAGPVDLMEMVWFTSADNTKLSINPLGQFAWHTDTSGTGYQINFTSNSTMADGTPLSNTGTHSDTPTPRGVRVIQIYPRNQQYDLTGSSSSTSDSYYCVAYLTDNTVLDVTDQVVFSSVDNATGQPTSNGTGFSPSVNAFGDFSINRSAPALVKIQAQYTRNGKTYSDSTLCEPLVPPPAP